MDRYSLLRRLGKAPEFDEWERRFLTMVIGALKTSYQDKDQELFVAVKTNDRELGLKPVAPNAPDSVEIMIDGRVEQARELAAKLSLLTGVVLNVKS